MGPINSKDDEIKFRALTEELKKGNELTAINKICFDTAKNYGIYFVTTKLLERYGLDKILKNNLSKTKHQFDVYEVLQALIINRLENPQSKNKAYQYIKKDYPKEVDCNKDDLYSTMDILYDNKENIELKIFESLKKQLKLNLKNVHYDITSTYFEGHKCEIALYGYSRDHRKDRKQIVVGLVLVDGIPIYHEVFEGNKQDKTTVRGVVKNLREKFKLKNATVIGDRGMLTEDNLQQLEIKNQKYVLGFSKDKNNITEKLLQLYVPIKKQKTQGAILGKTEIAEYNWKDCSCEFTRKYILCLDTDTKKEQLETLEQVKHYISEKLTELVNKYKKSQNNTKGKKMTYESLVVQVKKVISRNKSLYNIIWQNKENKIQGFEFELNKQWYEREKRAAGKFVIVTNTNDKPMEIFKTYKELNIVESCFNCVKNQLDIRPINHYKEYRVRAHIFICVLALLIEKIMERFLKNVTAQAAIEELQRIRVVDLTFENSSKNFISKITNEQNIILNKLKIVF